MSDIYNCTICGGKFEDSLIAIKWNQDVRNKGGVCFDCRSIYKKPDQTTKRIEKDSYNYITTTIRTALQRHSFTITERTLGGLKNENYVIWNLRGSSTNEYSIKVYLEIRRKEIKEYTYDWWIKTYDPEGNYLSQESDIIQNVPKIKKTLEDFFNLVGEDPYEFFKSCMKQILSKHFSLNEDIKEDEEKTVYYATTKNQFRLEVTVYKDFKWSSKAYRLSGAAYKEHNHKSFAIPPLKGYFNKFVKEIGGI